MYIIWRIKADETREYFVKFGIWGKVVFTKNINDAQHIEVFCEAEQRLSLVREVTGEYSNIMIKYVR